jgi:membrane-associated phospholipid phosphatase
VIVLLMAVSRVYSGSHWTSDVVGGLCLGLALGFVAVAIQRGAAR